MLHKVLLISPPFVQLNTPYPATAYLKGFLNTQNIDAVQLDLGIEVILQIFTKKGLSEIFHTARMASKTKLSSNSKRIISLEQAYLDTIEPVIRFLQNKNNTLAHLICTGNYLPEASRFEQMADLEWAFGSMGINDKARHIATLYLEDISDLIIETIDHHFGFSRYAERISASATTFDYLEQELQRDNHFIVNKSIEVLNIYISTHQPTLIAFSIPFPGNLFCALACSKWIKKQYPTIKICLGGGYPNTELRSLKDKRIFKYIDFITLDDGEAPLIHLLEYLSDKRAIDFLKRTFLVKNNEVVYIDGSFSNDYKHHEVGTPDYSDLPLDKYLSVIEITNPMHRLWSDGRWNKLTLAHGCYWGKCTFCDISLDYISRYESTTAKVLVDRMEKLIKQTGENGFHFVDEAAPPALMRDVALEILRRGLTIVWWTNIRFEKSFTEDLCHLLAASGCIAVSGGLEVASDRLLTLIKKGITVAQVAKVTDNFTQAGIMVHAYLMYGFPTQTAQETIDSLEMVRQLFSLGIVQSGFWHQFAMTAHSPVGIEPERFQVKCISTKKGDFANNDLAHQDLHGANHELFAEGLRKSLFNYMNGICFDYPLQQWFDFKVPVTSVQPNYIEQSILQYNPSTLRKNTKIVWLGMIPFEQNIQELKDGKALLKLSNKYSNKELLLSVPEAIWLLRILNEIHVSKGKLENYGAISDNYKTHFNEPIDIFWFKKVYTPLYELGLLHL